MGDCKIKRSCDWDLHIPLHLALDIDNLVEAIERGDSNIDLFYDEVDGSTRGASEETEKILRSYYLDGGWRE